MSNQSHTTRIADPKKHRLGFLDFLRFIAAFAVLFQHVFENIWPAFKHFTTYYFQCGLFGVMVFFLTSGFIIPVSLEKGASLKTFWISRIFRLFPLYLLSIVSVLISIRLGLYPAGFPAAKTIIINIFMFQHFLGVPDVMPLYWTLCLELLFYFIISAIFFFGFIKKTMWIALAFLALSFFAGGVAIGILHLAGGGWGMIFFLTSMFVGTLFYRLVNGELSARAFAGMMLLVLMVLLFNTYTNLYGKDQPALGGDKSFLPVTLAILAAYLVFFAAVSLRNIKFPVYLVYMGTISYSLYLVQGTILVIIPAIGNTAVTAVIWIGVTISVSVITYNLIEKPFIKIGKKLSGASSKKA
ncbi:acyltransferase [Mucilaginibacter sp.]|uniref:acyltransferase family protein n=1 Tax=Mucilaginibacter sp. TaxID=1882438 RepID=UPI0032653EE4